MKTQLGCISSHMCDIIFIFVIKIPHHFFSLKIEGEKLSSLLFACVLGLHAACIMFQGNNKGSSSAYYLQQSYPPGQQGSGGSATLPRGAGVIRAYSPANKPVSQAGKNSALAAVESLRVFSF